MGDNDRSPDVTTLWPLPQDSLKLLAHHQVLRPLVRQVMLTKTVADQTLTDEQRNQALVAFAQQNGLKSQGELEQFCSAQVLTPHALAHQVELSQRVLKLCRERFLSKAEAQFLARKSQLDQVVYSLLRIHNEGLARELFLQLQEGEASFAELASEFSDGPERTTRGIVGPVSLAQTHPLLVQRLRSAEVGSLLEPFQVEQWWLVVRLESCRPAIFDESMALQMSHELFEAWLEQQVDEELQKLAPLLLTSPVGAHP